MHIRKRGVIIGRVVGIVCALAIIVSGVTFAALQSQAATLKGNKITSATANLLIGDGQGGYGATTPGFDFNNVEPGGAAAPNPGYNLFLKNNGTSNLALKLALNPSTLLNPNNVNLERIYLNITPVSGTNVGFMQQFSLASLMSGYSNGSPVALNLNIPAGQITQYSLQVQIPADAITSVQSAIALTGIDLLFSGTSVVS